MQAEYVYALLIWLCGLLMGVYLGTAIAMGLMRRTVERTIGEIARPQNVALAAILAEQAGLTVSHESRLAPAGEPPGWLKLAPYPEASFEPVMSGERCSAVSRPVFPVPFNDPLPPGRGVV